MASGTITGSTSNQYIDSKIEWSSTKDIETNRSIVTATLYYRRNNSGYIDYGTGSFTIKIGDAVVSSSATITITESWTKAVSSGGIPIYHNTDGTKSVTISATGSISGTSLTSTSCSGTATLDRIPRFSEITSVTNTVLGSECAVQWTPASLNFMYELNFSMGSWSNTIVSIYPNQISAYTHACTIPLDVARQIPNSVTGTMTVTLNTYGNAPNWSLIGSSSKTFTVTVPDNVNTKPYATVTLSPILSSDVTGDFVNLYLQGYTRVKANSSASGQLGATIVWQSMEVEGKSYGSSSDYTSNFLSTSGNVSVKMSFRDSRGFTNSKTQTITVIPYSKPKAIPVSGEASVVCGRCTSDGTWSDSGTYLKIKAGRSYSKVMVNGVQKNFCGIRYRYKTSDATSYGNWINLLNNNDLSTNEVITGALLNGGLLVDTSYTVQVDVVDSIPNHTPMTFNIPTDTVYLHKAGSMRSLGVGKYAEKPNTVDIADDIAVRTGNSINGVFMEAKAVSGVSSFDIQTKYSEFTGSGNGNERQTLFLFGSANASMVYGLARVSNSGVTAWQGTSGVTLSTKSGGILTVTLPTTAYDMFTVLSCRKFTL